MDVLAWIFGIASMIANFIVYQQKERKKLLIAKMVVDSITVVHYSCLGAFSGAAICLVAIFRSFVFMNEDKKWARGKKWLIVFLAMNIILACFTWKNIFSIFPLLATAGAIFSFWQNNTKLTKILVYPISGCMIAYNIPNGSYTGLVNESFAIISATISLISMRRQRLKDEETSGKGLTAQTEETAGAEAETQGTGDSGTLA